MSVPTQLLVITNAALCRRPLTEVISEALEGGCRWLLVREKQATPTVLRSLLAELISMARPYGAAVSVSGDAAVALACGADGVHLPWGVPISRARMLLGRPMLLGVSAHSLDQARAAAEQGADYITLSPIFASPSKPGYGPPLGVSALEEAAAALGIPVVALGGISPDNARSCLAAGAAGVAVMGGVMSAEDPAGAVRQLRHALQP